MKIATFNVNNVNSHLPNLLQWPKAAKPDVACLQELKCTDAEFPAAAIRKAGYHAVESQEEDCEETEMTGTLTYFGAMPVVRSHFPMPPNRVRS